MFKSSQASLSHAQHFNFLNLDHSRNFLFFNNLNNGATLKREIQTFLSQFLDKSY